MDESEHFIDLHKQLMALSHSEGFIRLSRRDKLDELIQLCSRLLEVERASVWQLSNEHLSLDLETLFDSAWGLTHERVGLLQKNHQDYFNALLRERVIDVTDVYKDLRTRSFTEDYLPSQKILSMLDAPIFDHGQIYGVLCLESRHRRQWPLAEIAFVCAVADTISLINTYEAWQQSQQELDYVTHFDDLTGLSNHRALQKRLSHLVRPEQDERCEAFALAWINIDKLKQINEGLGQNIGDDIIVLVASKLRQLLVRGKDKVARIGGNEFAVVIRDPKRSDSLERTVEEFLDQLLKPLSLPELRLQVTLSAGVCFFPEDGRDASTLMRHAEAAMYQAKKDGPGSARFFNAKISQQARAQFALERELRRALDMQSLDVYYQPIVAADGYSLAGAEALVRWHHPERGLLAPAEFLPLAKAAGMMYDIDKTVISRVCRDLNSLSCCGIHLPRVAINLSAEQVLHPGLSANIAQLLDHFQIVGDQLEFEITEDVIQHDSKQLRRSLQALASLGPTLSIDDFGTGYSSLSRLKHLPFAKLKIDRSFIQDLPGNLDDCAITESIIGLARGLNMKVVAEGVETTEQLRWLAGQRVDFLQGYKIGRPMPLSELRDSYLANLASA
ncbi:putative bifunctional diguanylate cyclase/phosphodiesterase [Gilvimarinus algae]|uniref:Sensor domain-containing phosphodiesterase n=1 Tax=Gilvimarinus algae TaxID=3058037 RepID=A0ABT8THF5_9GAMM|nr:sensor domain-containing phosphodiesterase [Gilvimarinus sp. SDUM040014]MDO3381732.1 sensor domain-containing phosphodiesterase [Gilvimarinus sp. SDUM040014]